MRFTAFLSIIPFVALSSQSPVSKHVQRTPETNSSEPCQDVSNYISSLPNSTAIITVPAPLAYGCLTSIPFNSTATISFIEGLKNFFQFQSTLAYAANPPLTTHEREAVDLMDGFDEISKHAADGKYNNNYEFEADLRILIRKLHDGHIAWASNCLEGLFLFTHSFYIVALADSPDNIPEIYGAADFPSVLSGVSSNSSYSTSNYTISAISMIDDIPVNKYLSNWIEKTDSSFHDPDTRWNSLFLHRADGDFDLGAFSWSVLYLGDSFKVTFKNGTQKTIEWHAQVMTEFTDITSGSDLFFSQCLSETYDELSSTSTTNVNETTMTQPSSTPTVTRMPGYPPPHDISTDGALSTYLLDDGTGVILVSTFSESETEEGHMFQEFLTKAISDLKSCDVEYIIIDVTSNGGGSKVLGIDMFKQFFPDIEPWGAANMRAHPAAKVFFEVISEGIDSATNETVKEIFMTNPFSYYFQRDVNNSYYPSWEAAYGPIQHYNDSFTNLSRWDLVNEDAFGWEFNITNGDGVRNASYATPWDKENIIILGDGACSSTCAIFTEAMKEAGVRTFVYGGRPQKGPMQMIGGVEGNEVLTYSDLLRVSNQVLELHPEKANEWNFLPAELTFVPYPDYTMQSINLQNSFRKSETSIMSIPLEYVYDAADFRVQMTEDFFKDISLLWKEVACRVWNKK